MFEIFFDLKLGGFCQFLAIFGDFLGLQTERVIFRNVTHTKEFFRTCNVLPFSCTHLALWRQRQGKRPKVHAKQKGFKNFFNQKCLF